MLTKKQHELLVFIKAHLEETGISPSFDEMKVALNLRSKSGIHRLVTALEERGFVRRLPHRARALEILRLPDSPISPLDQSSSGSVIRPDFKSKKSSVPLQPINDEQTRSLPLYGRIAAGTPIEALRNQTNSIDVPESLIASGEHYALEVEGDSMTDAGIHDGDTVVIQRSETAENGSIVVALVDNQEVTLKRMRQKGNSVALESANDAYETRIFGPDRVQVQGILVGLMRRY